MRRISCCILIFLALYVPFLWMGFALDIPSYLFASIYLLACDICREPAE